MEIVKNIKKPIQKEINGENVDVTFAKEICAVDKGVYYGQPSDVNVIAVQTTSAATGIMNFMVAVYVKKETEGSRTKTDIVFAASAKGELLSNDERRTYFDIVRTAALRVSPLARRISMEHWRNKKKE